MLIVLPVITRAASECGTNNSFSGVAGSYIGQAASGTGCDSGPCYDNNIAGLRFRIYKYDGKGKPQPLGNGVDVWRSRTYISSDARYSDPNTDFLNERLSDSCDKDISWSKVFNLTAQQYIKKHVYFDSSIGKLGDFQFGDYILTYDSNKNPNSGWLYENLFKYIIKNENTSRIKDIFGVNYEDIVGDGKEIYIAAELMTRVDTYNCEGGCLSGMRRSTIYYGSVTDFSPTYAVGSMYVSLYNKSSFPTVGDLASTNINANNSKGSKYKIKIINPSTVQPFTKGGVNPIRTIIGNAGGFCGTEDLKKGRCSSVKVPLKTEMFCGATYGMAVYQFAQSCPGCEIRTCQSVCAGKQGAELEICGQAYCKDSKNKSDCLKDCSFSCGGKGCNNNTTCSVVTKVKDTTKSETCESNSSGQVKLTPTTTCESIGSDKLVKVECTEEFTGDMADLKNKKVVVNSKGNANLSLTFKINFTKKCNIVYAKKLANRKLGNNTCYVDTVNYDESELKTEITETETLLKKLDNDTNLKKECQYDTCMKNAKNFASKDRQEEEAKQCKSFCDNLKEVTQSKLKELNELASKAENELKNKVMEIGTDGKNGTKSETVQLELKYIPTDLKGKNLTETRTAVMKLVPIACNTTTEIQWCDPETKTQVKSSKNVITCDRDPNDVQIVIDPKTNGKSAVYEEEVYYSIPSSWIETRTDAEGTIYHDYLISDNGKDRSINITDLRTGKKECEGSKTVKAANGLCIEMPNTWTFNKLSDGQVEQLREVAKEVKITEGLKLTIAGKGSCGQFGYTLTCNYTEMAYKTCADECDKYKIGTKEFNQCVAKNCGCDSLCGDNVGCRTTYCPDPCPTCVVENECKNDECQNQCSKYTEGTNDYNICITENDCCDSYCKKKVADKTYSSEEQCKLKVCPEQSQCETKCNESIACLCNCCTEKCEIKVQNGEYKTVDDCRKVECPECDCPDCSDAYIYRTVDVKSPFPDRDPGENWFGKVNRITGDKTNATNDYVPEYSITLNSSQLNDLTKLYRNELQFKKFNNLENVATVSNLSAKEYCSSMLHGGDEKSREIFSNLKINVKTGCVK